MSRAAPALLVAGDPRHGVVRYADRLAGAVARELGRPVAVSTPPARGDLHVHFTDRLWGGSPAAAAQALEALSAARRLTVTLHDVPQASDGAGLERRRDAYRRVLACAAGALVSSEHERTLLHETETIADAAAVGVIPLALDGGAAGGGAVEEAGAVDEPGAVEGPRAVEGAGAVVEAEVALLGWLYPGKGHAEAIDAVAALPGPRPRVRALGAVSAGHEPLRAELAERASRAGVDFAVTGWLDDADLLRHLRAAAVPLAAHAHVSASSSMLAWIGAGRVPLVADGRYARELERVRPGTIRRYDPARLSAAVAGALRDPAGTRLAPGADTGPGMAEVARAHLAWWASP